MHAYRKFLCLIGAVILVVGSVAAQGASTPAKTEQKPAQKGVKSWKEILSLAADGSATVTSDITLVNWDSDTMDLPLAYGKPEGITVSCPDLIVTAQAGKTGDAKVLKLKFDKKPAAEEKLTLTSRSRDFWIGTRPSRRKASIPFPIQRRISHRLDRRLLAQDSPSPQLQDDSGSLVYSQAKNDDVEPPYDFSKEGDRLVVNLRAPSLAMGKTRAISFNFQPSNSAIAYIIVSIISRLSRIC
jgi:hypothetical protein